MLHSMGGESAVFDISLPHILVSLVGSGVGYVYLSYGKSQADWGLVSSGLLLMTYSYFVTSLVWLVLVGLAIAAAPFLWRRSD